MAAATATAAAATAAAAAAAALPLRRAVVAAAAAAAAVRVGAVIALPRHPVSPWPVQQQQQHHHRFCRCRSSSSSSSSRSISSTVDDDDDDDDGDDGDGAPAATTSTSTKALRVERIIANLGYAPRRECVVMLRRRRVTHISTGLPVKVGDKARAAELLLDGEPLDAPAPWTVLLHKPPGYVTTAPTDERVTAPTVYDLLPERFGRRRPLLAPIGRLDKDTSGLLVFTDDGALAHRIKSPQRAVWKRYVATLAAPLPDAAAAARLFASGRMLLAGDRTELLPAALRVLGGGGGGGGGGEERAGAGDGSVVVEVAVCEGRYHQVRRMLAAVGGAVVALHRSAIGGLALGAGGVDLAEGEWRPATSEEVAALLGGPDLAPPLPPPAEEGEALPPPAAAVAAATGEEEEEEVGGTRARSSRPLRGRQLGAGSSSSSSSSSLDDDDELTAASRRRRQHSRFSRRRAALREAATTAVMSRRAAAAADGGGQGADKR